jgi:leucine dehydrogenase
MLKIKEIIIPGFQKVIEAVDTDAGLHGFIAVHNSDLGPALGGVRMYPYKSAKEALDDALRLASCMTNKSALAENGLGGGKGVIIGDPHFDKTEKLFLSFGEAVDYLQGEYIAAEDVGITPEDLMIVRSKTPYVAALPVEHSSGDPSLFTARGVFRGIQAVAQHLWGTPSLKSKRITIQGLGHVGAKLAGFLFWEGANLIVTDIDQHLVKHISRLYGAEIFSSEQVYQVECDIFSPCAMGGIINGLTIPQLRCQAVAGSANNQLANPEDGLKLMKRGILYAPDYIINSGGIINASVEFDPQGYDAKTARDRVDKIYEKLINLFEISKKENKPTSQIADEMAQKILARKIGKRQFPIQFDKHLS